MELLMCPLARMPSLPHILTTPTTSVCFFSVIFNLVLFYFSFVLFTYLFLLKFLVLTFFLFVFCFIPADWVLQGRRSNQAVYTCIRASNLYLLTTMPYFHVHTPLIHTSWGWRMHQETSRVSAIRLGSLLSRLFSEAILTAMFAALVYVRGGFC